MRAGGRRERANLEIGRPDPGGYPALQHTGPGGSFDCNIGRILRSSHPRCCSWTAVGLVSPVVPGDRRLGLLAPLEMHPGCVSGRLTWLGSLLISSWGPWCPTVAQAAWAPIGPYHRVDGVCEAAWHAVWSFYRWFCGRQSARSRCGRGKIRRLVRCSNGVAPHRGLRDRHERRR